MSYEGQFRPLIHALLYLNAGVRFSESLDSVRTGQEPRLKKHFTVGRDSSSSSFSRKTIASERKLPGSGTVTIVNRSTHEKALRRASAALKADDRRHPKG